MAKYQITVDRLAFSGPDPRWSINISPVDHDGPTVLLTYLTKSEILEHLRALKFSVGAEYRILNLKPDDPSYVVPDWEVSDEVAVRFGWKRKLDMEPYRHMKRRQLQKLFGKIRASREKNA